MLKPVAVKKSAKQDRERQVLIGLVELYLKSGKPIGSNTLKEFGFEELSSATIRNYFAHMETEGYLSQQHSSGGRIPTAKAFRLYAQEYEHETYISPNQKNDLSHLRSQETKELSTYLQQAAELLSNLTQTAVFLSAPRFDHDYINDIKIVGIDPSRCVCVIVTNFGVIKTEVLHLDKKLSSFSLKRIENYFRWRLYTIHGANGTDESNKPDNLTEEEEHLAQQFYHEIMMRFIVGYSHFQDEDIYRTGFSKLLVYPDLQETTSLVNCLSLFENVHSIRLLLKECGKKDTLRFWIGEDLNPFSNPPYNFSVITIPYHINKQCVGAIGLLGPIRLPYKQLFGLLRYFSESVSEALTRSIYKFKITFRQPQSGEKIDDHSQIGHFRPMLIEHNR
jgi:heat-inducible transcriptional repressor